MKHLSYIFIAVAWIFFTLLTACNNEEQTYDGPSYVMFSDSLNVCPVFQDNNAYKVTLSATRSASYDRRFGIEVLQSKSNAIEGYHYTMQSNTVTIPAGQLAASVEVCGIYENIQDDDSLNIRMRIISLDDVEWSYYGIETNVRLKKVCPFVIDNFTRYAVVKSSFLTNYKPYAPSQRLIMTERVEGEPNSVMLRNFMTDGYDVRLTLDNSDPLNPVASLRTGDIIGTTQEFLGALYNDNVLRVTDYVPVPSTFSTSLNTVTLYTVVYVKDVGNLGAFTTTIRWVSDAEAEDILKNGF